MPARRRLLLFFGLNYLAQGMSGLVYEPVSYLLKDSLGLGPGEMATFVAWMTAPFLFKPLLGLLTDFLPLGGRLRRPHLILGAALGALGWLTLALGPDKPGYKTLLALLIAVNVSVVFCDVVCDGVMVEASRKEGSSALFQSVQIGTLYATLVVTGLGGGWLTTHAPSRVVFALACGFSLLTLASALLVSEPAAAAPRGAGLSALKDLLLSSRFWMVSGVILLWNFSPFLGTAQFYFQSEHLRLSAVFIGLLGTLGGLAGVAGAAAFNRLAEKGPLERVLLAGVWLGAPLNLLYLLYRGAPSVAAITVGLGFVGVIFRLALMDMAARSCPEGGEATAFAAYMSVFNLAAWASNTAGGKLYGQLADPVRALYALCLVGAAATAASWPLVRALQGTMRRAPK